MLKSPEYIKLLRSSQKELMDFVNWLAETYPTDWLKYVHAYEAVIKANELETLIRKKNGLDKPEVKEMSKYKDTGSPLFAKDFDEYSDRCDGNTAEENNELAIMVIVKLLYVIIEKLKERSP